MSSKTNLLFIQTQAAFGADSAVHAHLMRHLDRSRFAVHVACTAGEGSTRAESLKKLEQIPDVSVRIVRFLPGIRERTWRELADNSMAALAAPFDLVQLVKYARQHDIRIVHSSERPRDALYNRIVARLSGARSVVHVHVKWSHDYGTTARLAVRNADAVFSISNYVTQTLVATGRNQRGIYTVLNGIDLTSWNPNTSGTSVREELAIPPDAFVLASVSRLFVWKGQRELIRAFAKVRQHDPNVVLLIVGADAPHETESFTAELKQLARELGVIDAIRFTGPRADVPQIMAACDLFTMPSFEEPFGLVFVEAMAMQKPVVAINNGGTPEVVEHEVTGLLSPPWDIDALAANIVRLLRDHQLRARMGAAGRQRALSHFSAQRMADDAGNAYESLLMNR